MFSRRLAALNPIKMGRMRRPVSQMQQEMTEFMSRAKNPALHRNSIPSIHHDGRSSILPSNGQTKKPV